MVYDINQFMFPACDTFDTSGQERLKRLKYVTENFSTLQGLRTAVLGVTVLLIKFRSNSLFVGGWLKTLTMPVVIICGVAYLRFLPKYYERLFGRVEQQAPDMTNSQGCAFFGTILALLVCSLVVPHFGRSLDNLCDELSQSIHAMLDDPDHRLNFSPILYWSLLFVLSLSSSSFRRGQPIDLRITSFWLVLTLFWCVVITLPVHQPDLVNVTWWKILNTGWLGISLIMTGICDHLTLVFLLPRTSEAEQ